MEKIIKQSVGIDCAKDELVVAFGVMDAGFDSRIVSNKTFRNDKSGFTALLSWSKKLRQEEVKVAFVIEATGVYHELFSLFLHQQGEMVSVILPNKIKNFAKTEKIKTVNDKVSAQTIAQFGLEKKLEAWQPPHEVYNQLKQLTREREQLNQEMAQIKNQLHAEQSGAWPNKGSIRRMKQRLTLIEKQLSGIREEIVKQVNANADLKERVNNICTIKGVGLITAVTVIAETNGFNLIRNKKQLVSYAGLDVQEKDSGTSVHHKPRISRKGNKYIRKAVYLPALAAIRSSANMKALFARLVSKHGIKMKAAVAVQRKLLELIYVLWKKNEPFNPKYNEYKKLEQLKEAALNEMA
jgi:transposase